MVLTPTEESITIQPLAVGLPQYDWSGSLTSSSPVTTNPTPILTTVTSQPAAMIPPRCHPAIEEARLYIEVCLYRPGEALPPCSWAPYVRRLDFSAWDISEEDSGILMQYLQYVNMMMPRQRAVTAG